MEDTVLTTLLLLTRGWRKRRKCKDNRTASEQSPSLGTAITLTMMTQWASAHQWNIALRHLRGVLAPPAGHRNRYAQRLSKIDRIDDELLSICESRPCSCHSRPLSTFRGAFPMSAAVRKKRSCLDSGLQGDCVLTGHIAMTNSRSYRFCRGLKATDRQFPAPSL